MFSHLSFFAHEWGSENAKNADKNASFFVFKIFSMLSIISSLNKINFNLSCFVMVVENGLLGVCRSFNSDSAEAKKVDFGLLLLRQVFNNFFIDLVWTGRRACQM